MPFEGKKSYSPPPGPPPGYTPPKGKLPPGVAEAQLAMMHQQMQAGLQPPQTSGGGTGMLIGVLALLLVGGGAGIYFLTR